MLREHRDAECQHSHERHIPHTHLLVMETIDWLHPEEERMAGQY
jgi:hypothetical protein